MTRGRMRAQSPISVASWPFGGGWPPHTPPYSPPNCRTPLGVAHWLAAAPVVLVPGAHVAGGDGRRVVATNLARQGGDLGRPPRLLAPPPAPPPHPLQGGDGRRQATPGGGPVGPGMGQRPRPPAPTPPWPAATWLDVANAVRALLPLVTDVWWAGARGDPCHGSAARRSPPYRPGA